MNTTQTAPATRSVGRPLTTNSVNMSAAIVKAKFVDGKTLQEIADSYTNSKRFRERKPKARTFTAQSVRARIMAYAEKFPKEYAAIVGVTEAPKAVKAKAVKVAPAAVVSAPVAEAALVTA